MPKHIPNDNAPADESTSWRWVNQNKTFKQEYDGGYIWAQKKQSQVVKHFIMQT